MISMRAILTITITIIVATFIPATFALASSPQNPSMTTPSSTTSKGLILVTGGSRGIGQATCLLLASRGYDVAVNYCSNEVSAKSVIESIDSMRRKQQQGDDHQRVVGKAIAFRADVSKEDEVVKLFDEVSSTFGMEPTGLVNNAGISGPVENDIASLEVSDLTKVLMTNTYGPFLCCREFVRRTSTKRGGKGGVIVNISSGIAYIGNPIPYAMSKGALDSMSAGLSKTLPQEGIRINSIVPGPVDTEMITKERAKEVSAAIPMGRVGKPEEIAEGVLFFLSEASSFCSGAKIRMAGGKP